MNEIKLNKQGLDEAQFLKTYDASKYDRPSVTVDMLIFTVTNTEKENYRKLPDKALRILLIKRGDHPYIGQWALPGGFVQMDESLDEAAIRELKEETNVDNVYMEQLYTWGDVGRDPRTRVISTSYMTLADSSTMNIVASDDADDAKWFSVKLQLLSEDKISTEKGYKVTTSYKLKLSSDDETIEAELRKTETIEGKITKVNTEVLSSNGIAFDHAKIIAYGIERLRAKIEYTDIAFNLMPELFTLTELQQVYEMILDQELLKANFRRKISHMVIETDEYRKDAGHRPSKLFKFNHNWKHDNRVK